MFLCCRAYLCGFCLYHSRRHLHKFGNKGGLMFDRSLFSGSCTPPHIHLLIAGENCAVQVPPRRQHVRDVFTDHRCSPPAVLSSRSPPNPKKWDLTQDTSLTQLQNQNRRPKIIIRRIHPPTHLATNPACTRPAIHHTDSTITCAPGPSQP